MKKRYFKTYASVTKSEKLRWPAETIGIVPKPGEFVFGISRLGADTHDDCTIWQNHAGPQNARRMSVRPDRTGVGHRMVADSRANPVTYLLKSGHCLRVATISR